MKEAYYIINKLNEVFGPLTLDDVVSLVKSKKASLNEFLYDVENKKVDYIGTFPRFEAYLPRHPKVILEGGVYYSYQDDKVNGPFLYEDVIDLIMTGKLSVFDYLNSNDGLGWVIVKDIPTFSDYLPKLENYTIEKMGIDLASTAIIKTYIRRYKRSPYSAKASISWNGKEYSGHCSSISMGGCFLEIAKKIDFEEGAIIQLSILPDLVKIKINCSARVCTVNDKGVALEFLNLNSTIKTQINEFVESFVEKNT